MLAANGAVSKLELFCILRPVSGLSCPPKEASQAAVANPSQAAQQRA